MRLPQFISLFLLLTAFCFGNSDVRNWHLASGQTFRAELVSYAEDSGRVTLKFDDVEDRVYAFDDFGLLDKAWLVEWIEFEESLRAELDLWGGDFEHLVTVGAYPTELFVYYPSSIKDLSALPPAMILFHPGGKGARYCLRHVEAAEAAGMVLIACNEFRNTDDNFELESAMLARFKEVFPQILQRVELDRSRVFLGGTSGGAWRAYHYSAWVDFPWAGIYANVGWLGGQKYYKLPYPAGMRVVMVDGNQDCSGGCNLQQDSEILQAAGNEVAVIVFEGGHQVPPVGSQIKAFSWLLELESFQEL